MWFGTRNGLNKFNGNSFEIFWNHADDPHSISSNTIACITEDAEANLWIGTENGLNKLDKSRNSFKRYYLTHKTDSMNNKILSLYLDKENILWVGTLSGLFIYEPESDNLKAVPIKELVDNSISAILEKDNELYLASSRNGLLIYDKQKKRVARSFRTDSKTLPISSNYLKDIYIDKKDNIWLGTYKDGVCVIKHDLSEIVHYNTSNGAQQLGVKTLTEQEFEDMLA